MKGIVCILIAAIQAGIALGQRLDAQGIQLSSEMSDQIASGLRWIAYWEPDSIIKYKAGETIHVKFVQGPDELVVFLSRIRLSVTFHRSSSGKLDRLYKVGGLSRIGNETLDSDVHFYIQQSSAPGTPGFRLAPGNQALTAGFGIPAARVTVGQALKPEPFRVSDATFRLPDLAPPRYVSDRIKPPAAVVDGLRSAVTKAVQIYMAANSKPATVVIPYFSQEDPAVNVFVHFDEPDFSEGIFWVTPDADGQWSIGKLFLNRSLERLDSTIAKIRDLKLLEFAVAADH